MKRLQRGRVDIVLDNGEYSMIGAKWTDAAQLDLRWAKSVTFGVEIRLALHRFRVCRFPHLVYAFRGRGRFPVSRLSSSG